jgi:hypothetical protein
MKTLLCSLCLTLPLIGKELPVAAIATTAAEQFLASLDADQKSKAVKPFSDEERQNFRFTPRERFGLKFKEMSEEQRDAAMKLLDTALSEKGKLKVTQIMTLEAVLAEIEKNPTYRDAGKYCVAVFGTPGDKKGWGWRFEGHHVSVNITIADDKGLSVTPSFLGSNPAEVRVEGKHLGLRVLAAEQDLAIALVNTLREGGKTEVIFSEKAPDEIITGENREVTALDPVGVLASDMTETQRAGLLNLIHEYTGRFRAEIAAADMAKIEKAGIDQIRFGWAGGTKPGEAYYYRIQGPTFLMESCNVQNQANHIHATWRDFNGDFGRDLLREHLSESPH